MNEMNTAPMSAEETKKLEGEIKTAIDSCMQKLASGEYKTREEAIDALVDDLEALKEGEKEMPNKGGFPGMNERSTMSTEDLPEA